MNALLIFLGGGLGSLARYGTGKFFAAFTTFGFPFGTLAANIISSLLLGIFLGLASGKPEQLNSMKFFIAIGFCGGFSTFSTFSAETFELIKNGMIGYAAINILISVVVCIISIAAGIWFGRLANAAF
jgi:CrcB protein